VRFNIKSMFTPRRENAKVGRVKYSKRTEICSLLECMSMYNLLQLAQKQKALSCNIYLLSIAYFISALPTGFD
jgi:hypothetical protein